MSTITITFKDADTQTFHNAQGSARAGESWMSVGMRDGCSTCSVEKTSLRLRSSQIWETRW